MRPAARWTIRRAELGWRVRHDARRDLDLWFATHVAALAYVTREVDDAARRRKADPWSWLFGWPPR